MDEGTENLSPEKQQRMRRRRRLLLWLLGATVTLLLSIIVSQQLWLWTVVRPDTTSDALALYALSTLNFVAFVVFSFIFVRNLLKLRRERKERELGSKVKTRLLVYFISISFLPVTAMAVFSYLFLNRSLEKWFYPFPEIVEQAGEVKRATLATQNRSLHDVASLLVMLLNQQDHNERQTTVDQLISSGQLVGVEIVQADGSVSLERKAKLSDADSQKVEALFSAARKTREALGDSLADGKGFDVLAVPLNQSETLVVAFTAGGSHSRPYSLIQ